VARQPRSLLPDGPYHVTCRGVEHRAVFADDSDRRDFLSLLQDVGERWDWTFHALCLMTSHYHLVLESTRAGLSDGMHRLNAVYAQRFNIRHDRWGHLFGDRFACRMIESEEHLHTACRYVIQNPVDAGLCDRAADWPWSYSRHGFGD
jgi:putative transposase